MAKIKRVLRCHSCGAILQTENKNLSGYISKDVLEKTNPKIPYCNTCYEKMLMLNADGLEESIDNDIVKVLDDAVATDAVIIWVVDLVNFNGVINKLIVRKIRNLKVIVVATRRDFFPSRIDNSTFVRFIKERFAEVGIKPTEIKVINERGLDGAAMFNEINKLRKGHDVYLIGYESSGKSALVSKMLKDYENKSKWTIRSEFYPGTSAKVLEIPITNSAFFYELPDFSEENSLVSKVEKDTLKHIVAHKDIEITNKRLSFGEAIMVGSLGVVELLAGKNTAFKFFAAPGVEYKKVAVDHVDEEMKENIKKRTVRPVSEKYTLFTDFDIFDLTMEMDGELHDISITGLCTASFVARGQNIRVILPKGVALKESLSKIR